MCYVAPEGATYNDPVIAFVIVAGTSAAKTVQGETADSNGMNEPRVMRARHAVPLLSEFEIAAKLKYTTEMCAAFLQIGSSSDRVVRWSAADCDPAQLGEFFEGGFAAEATVAAVFHAAEGHLWLVVNC